MRSQGRTTILEPKIQGEAEIDVYGGTLKISWYADANGVNFELTQVGEIADNLHQWHWTFPLGDLGFDEAIRQGLLYGFKTLQTVPVGVRKAQSQLQWAVDEELSKPILTQSVEG